MNQQSLQASGSSCRRRNFHQVSHSRCRSLPNNFLQRERASLNQRNKRFGHAPKSTWLRGASNHKLSVREPNISFWLIGNLSKPLRNLARATPRWLRRKVFNKSCCCCPFLPLLFSFPQVCELLLIVCFFSRFTNLHTSLEKSSQAFGYESQVVQISAKMYANNVKQNQEEPGRAEQG